MTAIANTPRPPYYAVIFSSERTGIDQGYAEMARYMLDLAAMQPGFLGVESARDSLGITVSYWTDLESISNWRANAEHRQAQAKGREVWYAAFTVRIAKVERDYSLSASG
jgi:heme-degrading monooxygenase HmoA